MDQVEVDDAEVEQVEVEQVDLGRVGVWLPLHQNWYGSIADVRSLVARIDQLGYGSLWSGETPGGKEVFAFSGMLLAETSGLVIGTGIANMWLRHGSTMQCAANTLAEAYPGRFVLGVGAGYPQQAEYVGRTYGNPIEQLRTYLDQMDAVGDPDEGANPADRTDEVDKEDAGAAAAGQANRAPNAGRANRAHGADRADRADQVHGADRAGRRRVPRVLAAGGPRMLALAGERTDGAHSFLAPVEHTAYARERLGTGKLLIPHQAVMLASGRDEVRETLTAYLGGPPASRPESPYYKNMLRFGFTDAELTAGADRVIDALVAWGDEDSIAARVAAQHEAGADSVLVHPIPAPGRDTATQLERLAGVLLHR